MYIHQRKDWPHFTFDQTAIMPALKEVHQLLDALMDKMETLATEQREKAVLNTLNLEIINSAEIENEYTDAFQVNSAIARHLGILQAEPQKVTNSVDGMVAMVLDSTHHCFQPITENKLLHWHAGLFPTGLSGQHKITVANWRKDVDGPMEVVSETDGQEKVNFQAPPASAIPTEMQKFISWFNDDVEQTDLILKAAMAHLWFVTIHPFDDGNGRITRALTEMMLARSDKSTQRYYSMSTQLRLNRKAYCEVLELAQKGSMDITAWLQWFLDCLRNAITSAEIALYIQKHKVEL